MDESCWCDPCRIKDNGVTGRYFVRHGFLWICVELCGLQTRVTLRSSLTVFNYCEFPVLFQVNGKKKWVSEGSNPQTLEQEKPDQFHSNCISLDGSKCTLPASGLEDANGARVMIQSLLSMEIGKEQEEELSCLVVPEKSLPDAFDLVKVEDEDDKKGNKTLVSFPSKHRNESCHYAWVKIARAQCRTVLPTDFDPLQSQVSNRYTWIEVSVWPALTVENRLDMPPAVTITQQNTRVKLELGPFHAKKVSVINPCESFDVELQDKETSIAVKALTLSLQGTKDHDPKEQTFVFARCKVVATFGHERHPMVRLRVERLLSVVNMTPSALTLQLSSLSGKEQSVDVIESGVERALGFPSLEPHVVISIADSFPASDQTNWSPHVVFDAQGDVKSLVVPHTKHGQCLLS